MADANERFLVQPVACAFDDGNGTAGFFFLNDDVVEPKRLAVRLECSFFRRESVKRERLLTRLGASRMRLRTYRPAKNTAAFWSSV